MNYLESNADERAADLAERQTESLRALNIDEQLADESEFDLDAYTAYWLGRVS